MCFCALCIRSDEQLDLLRYWFVVEQSFNSFLSRYIYHFSWHTDHQSVTSVMQNQPKERFRLQCRNFRRSYICANARYDSSSELQ